MQVQALGPCNTGHLFARSARWNGQSYYQRNLLALNMEDLNLGNSEAENHRHRLRFLHFLIRMHPSQGRGGPLNQ